MLRNCIESIITGFINGSSISIYGLYDNIPCYDSIVFILTRLGLTSDIKP